MEPQIPIFALYGEPDPGDALPEPLHWESISARSRLHGGRIAPHRHAGLSQFFWLSRGGARLLLDGTERRLRAGMAAFVPAPVVHGFAFDPGAEGHVLTMQRADAEAPGLDGPLALRPAPEDAAELEALLALLAAEFAARRPGRDEALRAHGRLVALWFARQASARAPARAAPAADEALVRRFLSLVEARIAHPAEPGRRAAPRVAEAAAALGVSAAHLSRACRRRLGASAQELIHRRLVAEARRRLIFTSMSVAQVGWSLGFGDPAHFSRFFARRAGAPPSALRRAGAAGDDGGAGGIRGARSRRPRPDT
ncbi:helix-turn-helix domain-containing protein [Oceanicella actignis]|uniref:AraC family transcriptional regulator, transcriptional activator of pobA n=1 Tax=Oceanicella actignis TaxID=1189325 RepID=A0A1M7S7U5_9RHOB|nr:helix-turn-helix domain-containing protein [Oceanicella actignis]SET33351.1 AraC family transcriptional regulator, transcriptional activator of pobA [Oceanicella actignis]SHN54536.1 AraC family transcriptional regulator, transcriptional activator of pobA [Oceanicella actignis]